MTDLMRMAIAILTVAITGAAAALVILLLTAKFELTLEDDSKGP